MLLEADLSRPSSPPMALVREVPDTFPACVSAVPPDPPLDVDLARHQHAEYVAALALGGYQIETVAPDPAHPDSVFVEDSAVVLGDAAMVCRSGEPSRRGETGPVAEALAHHVTLSHLPEAATLDGGDVLQAGGKVYVGRSTRTNDAGIAALAGFADRPVEPVPVEGVLHLKSAVTAIDDTTLLAHPGFVDTAAFEGVRVIAVGGHDPEAANVVRLADGRVLVGAGHESTAAAIEAAGFGVVVCDVSEFGRADGGLTCLSIRMRDVAPPASYPDLS